MMLLREGPQPRKFDAFSFTLSLTKKFYHEIMDFMCVLTCFWTVLWLIYMCFLKDFLDIAAFTIAKLSSRIHWLLKISGIRDLIQSVTSFERYVHSTQSGFETGTDVTETSPARISVTLSEADTHLQLSPETPQSSQCTYIDPRRVRLQFKETPPKDVAYVSPVQRSYFKQKLTSWNFFGMKSRDAYSPHNYSMPDREFCRIQETIRRTPSAVRQDKENLILNDSPEERVSCCRSILSFFGKRSYMRDNLPSMHYQRF